MTATRLVLFAWSSRRTMAASLLAVGFLGLTALAAVMTLAWAPAAGAAPLLAPVARGTLTQRFGCTIYTREPWSESCPTHHFHSGVDLAGPLETPVLAAASGRALVLRERGGYGLYIVIVHDPRLSTLYAHLWYPLIASGDWVLAGQTIGLMGSSGNSSGPHLHFEVRIGGIPVDPLPLLPSTGWGGDGKTQDLIDPLKTSSTQRR